MFEVTLFINQEVREEKVFPTLQAAISFFERKKEGFSLDEDDSSEFGSHLGGEIYTDSRYASIGIGENFIELSLMGL